MADLFDMTARVQRRDRAVRNDAETFLEQRAIEDVCERLDTITRRFDRALLIGALDPAHVAMLARRVDRLEVVDPSPRAATNANGRRANENEIDFDPGSFDLIVASGTLATVNDLSEVLLRLRFLLDVEGLLIGFVAGGDLLPQLRRAMAAADSDRERHSPRFHPRLDPAGLTQLLAASGLQMPVVDVDRVEIRYSAMADLVRDLRGMGATNVLVERSRQPMSRAARSRAQAAFIDGARDGRVSETIELLHFMGWAPA